MFFAIVVIVLTLNGIWWVWMDRRLKRDGYGAKWRIPVVAWAIAAVAIPMLTNRFGSNALPRWMPAAAFLWMLLAMPMAVSSVLLLGFGLRLTAIAKRKHANVEPTFVEKEAIDLARFNRRQILTAAAIAAPPFFTGVMTGVSAEQLGVFRTRSMDLKLPGLPPSLSGMTLAVVADVHTGPFTTPRMLEEIVHRTNTISNGSPADMVILAGDLINTTLRDLPAGLEMAKSFKSRLGTYAIVGNHDVMDWAPTFFKEFDKTSIPLLRDQILTVTALPGINVQLLGMMWHNQDRDMFAAIAHLATHRDPTLFPICLAHHPHAWDEAQRRGLPLVISGHTHGGQIMFTKNIGAGPLKFRYWTGLYQAPGSQLVVSNGVGNWFPLRINAPAELLKLTLYPAV